MAVVLGKYDDAASMADIYDRDKMEFRPPATDPLYLKWMDRSAERIRIQEEVARGAAPPIDKPQRYRVDASDKIGMWSADEIFKNFASLSDTGRAPAFYSSFGYVPVKRDVGGVVAASRRGGSRGRGAPPPRKDPIREEWGITREMGYISASDATDSLCNPAQGVGAMLFDVSGSQNDCMYNALALIRNKINLDRLGSQNTRFVTGRDVREYIAKKILDANVEARPDWKLLVDRLYTTIADQIEEGQRTEDAKERQKVVARFVRTANNMGEALVLYAYTMDTTDNESICLFGMDTEYSYFSLIKSYLSAPPADRLKCSEPAFLQAWLRQAYVGRRRYRAEYVLHLNGYDEMLGADDKRVVMDQQGNDYLDANIRETVYKDRADPKYPLVDDTTVLGDKKNPNADPLERLKELFAGRENNAGYARALVSWLTACVFSRYIPEPRARRLVPSGYYDSRGGEGGEFAVATTAPYDSAKLVYAIVNLGIHFNALGLYSAGSQKRVYQQVSDVGVTYASILRQAANVETPCAEIRVPAVAARP